MKKIYSFLFSILLATISSFAQNGKIISLKQDSQIISSSGACKELFISEMIDGTNLDKSVEIFNPGNSPVNLSIFSIKVFHSGNSVFVNIPLSGIIQPKKTFVVSHPQANNQILAKTDMTSNQLNFNGSEAIVLAKQGNNIDKIGEIGIDPGSSGWTIPPTGSTKEHDLRRQFPITQGDTNWATTKLQWNVFHKDSIQNLHLHQNVCTPTDLYLSFDNQTTDCSNPDYFQFDITAYSSPYTTIFNSTVIDITYSTGEFDTYIANNVQVQNGSNFSSVDYGTATVTDLSSNVIEISFGDNSTTTPNGYSIPTSSPGVTLLTVSIPIKTCQPSLIDFTNTSSTSTQSVYTEQIATTQSYTVTVYDVCGYDTSGNPIYCPVDSVYSVTTYSYQNTSYNNTIYSPVGGFNSFSCPMNISSVTPSVNGGTNVVSVPSNSSLLTITGSGFGNNQGSIKVPDANLSTTAPTITLDNLDIISWSENKIVVKMPSTTVASGALTPGSGTFNVNNDCGSSASDNLQIYYSIRNDIFSSASNEKVRINIVQEPSQVAGSYIFWCDTSVSHNAKAFACVKKAIATWNCNTGVNWMLAGDTVVTSSMEDNSDGISCIFFSDNFPSSSSSAAMLTKRHTLSCPDFSDSIAFNNDADIRMRITLGNIIPGLVWNYDTTATNPLQPNAISFYDAILHELGHAHLLNHVNNYWALMYAAVSPGGIRRDVLSGSETVVGAMDVIHTSVATLPNNTCTYSVVFVAPGSNCNPFGSGVSNLLQNEYGFSIFPNPVNDENIIVSYQLNKNAFVQFKIVDYTGREVMMLDNEKKTAGTYSERINISTLAEGIYLFMANINGEYQTVKLIKL